MSSLLRFLLLSVAALTAFAFAQISPIQNQYGPVVKWRTIAQGDNSKIVREEARLLSGDNEWERYYREMIGAKPKERVQVPRVADWSKEDILVLHIGKRPSYGYGVYVETIGRSASNFFDIHYVLQEPPQGAELDERQTSPFVVIAIEKTTGTPRYFGRVSTQATYILPNGCACGARPVIMVGQGGRVIPLSDGNKCSKCGAKIPVYGPGATNGGKTGGNNGSTGGTTGGGGQTNRGG